MHGSITATLFAAGAKPGRYFRITFGEPEMYSYGHLRHHHSIRMFQATKITKASFSRHQSYLRSMGAETQKTFLNAHNSFSLSITQSLLAPPAAPDLQPQPPTTGCQRRFNMAIVVNARLTMIHPGSLPMNRWRRGPRDSADTTGSLGTFRVSITHSKQPCEVWTWW